MTIAASPITSRKSILVVDDSDLCRELTADCLRVQGFNTLEATDGEAAFRQMERNRVDLVILDYEMPGMNGLVFLKALRSSQAGRAMPVIMLTASTSKEVVVEAMRLGVRGYLLKARFTMPDLMARIASALGGEPAHQMTLPAAPRPTPNRASHLPASATASDDLIPKPAAQPNARGLDVARPRPARPRPSVARPASLVARSAMMQAITEITSTKTLAGVVAEVVALVNSPHSSLTDLAAILKQDPILSSRVVQLACSSAYAGSKSKLATIDDAARVVGGTAIRDLALTIGIFDTFPPDRADGLDLLRCWQHAFGVAAAMEKIVPRSDAVPAGTPHFIGLCHDLGEIMVRQRFPAEYAVAVDFARSHNQPISLQFPAIFGITAGEIVQTLLDRMKLPPLISQPINEFWKNARSPTDAHRGLLARSLAIANFFAHALALVPSTEEPIAPVLLSDCRTSLLPTAQIDWANIGAEAACTISLLSKLRPDEEAAMTLPLIPRLHRQVGYLRHHSFAELDPIETAINTVSNGVTIERGARPEDLHGLDGLIALSPAADNSLAAEAIRLRSLAGLEIPILHIIPPRNPPSIGDVTAFEEIAYPVTLKRLSRFASMLKQE